MNERWLRAAGLLAATVLLLGAGPADLPDATAPVAAAAQRGASEEVRALLQQGEDVNASGGDGMTALHWASLSGDVEMARMLLYAGANVHATTRLGAYTPLFLAAKNGSPRVISLLLEAGAEADAVTSTGATALMLAAASGRTESVETLIEHGADVNHAESGRGHTPLMFAAANDRAGVVDVLVSHGASLEAATRLIDVPELEKADRAALRAKLQKQKLEREKKASEGQPEPPEPEPKASGKSFFGKLFGWMKPGKTDAAAPRPAARRRRTSYGELVGRQGGLTPLLIASRQGHAETVATLLRHGADVNGSSEGTRTSPLLIATMNGHFDLAMKLLDAGADPNVANEPAGVTPLYATINLWYAPHTSYPQPQAHRQQRVGHLELMEALLKRGADPNVRLRQKIWFSAYNFDQSGLNETGATPFWRAAYGSDVAAMKLLRGYGADPSIATKKPPERPRVADQNAREITDVSGLPPVPEGGPAIAPIHAATGAGYGEGFAANEHRNHPAGFLPAVRYLVEECGADVNARDHEGNTPLHNAAARGDVELIEYLVSQGADVTLLNREGQTTADMANGPVQRIQPFPEALALLTSLGAKNNGKCVSC